MLALTFTGFYQGSAKVWINFNGSGTISTRDSYNVSSITDDGTGVYTVNINNDMNNTSYSTVGAGGEYADSGGNRMLGLRLTNTGSKGLRGFKDGSSHYLPEVCIAILGDLA